MIKSESRYLIMLYGISPSQGCLLVGLKLQELKNYKLSSFMSFKSIIYRRLYLPIYVYSNLAAQISSKIVSSAFFWANRVGGDDSHALGKKNSQ
jgi:hypothetical protein